MPIKSTPGSSILVLDGGLGSELEFRGYHTGTPLWSAKAVSDAPELIEEIHQAFFDAGAEAATTNSYQASIPGYVTHLGTTVYEAQDLLWKTVVLANKARETACKTRMASAAESDNIGNLRDLLVLRGCGPYGAFLHDCSEYTGVFPSNVTNEMIKEFHRSRLEVLTRDLQQHERVYFETIPCAREADLILDVLREFPAVQGKVWMSFCGKEEGLRDGTPLPTVVQSVLEKDGGGFITTVGLNCTQPHDVASLLDELQRERCKDRAIGRLLEGVEIMVKPNSGEVWDDVLKKYCPSNDSLIAQVNNFSKNGVAAIGGCCRVRPAEVALLRREIDRLQAEQRRA